MSRSWELFFADDLVIIATSLEECVERVKAWKEGLESKGLHVNMTKTKFMASGLGLDILQDYGKFPCAVCRTGVGRSSIRCSKCNLWVHYKKCSGLNTLSEDLSYECPRCRGVPGVRPVDGRPFKEVEVGDCVLEAVDCFCYLGDMLSAGGGCMAAATARCRCAWGKFRENLPLLTSKPVPFDLRGRLFSSNVRTVETPYSTIPYTTIFYITRWTHGPQNLQRPIRTLIVLLGFWIKQSFV